MDATGALKEGANQLTVKVVNSAPICHGSKIDQDFATVAGALRLNHNMATLTADH